jgi:O-antigen ligase
MVISRSAIISTLLVAAFWFAVATPQRRLRGVMLAGSMSTLLFLTTPGLLGTIRSYFMNIGSDTSISTRTSDYAAVAPFIRQSPWIGRGPATFLPKFRILDNQWLASLIETGILGMAGLIVFVLTPGLLGTSLRRSTTDPLFRDLGQALLGMSAVVIFLAMSFDLLAYPMAPAFLAIFLGIAGALWSFARLDAHHAPLRFPDQQPSFETPPICGGNRTARR